MRFVLWSEHGDSVFLAKRLQAEGHQVALFTRDPGARDVGRGLVERTRTVPSGAVVLIDHVGDGKTGAALRARGHAVIGGNPFDRHLELDRTAGTKLMGAVGIATPKTVTFRTYAEAARFLADQEGTWFVKPSGNQTTGLTMNGPPALLIRYLAFALPQLPAGTPFELQKKVEGLEISVEGWFDGQRFVPPWNATFEDKKFLAGDLGMRCGCATNVVWRLDNARLAEATVGRLAERLKLARYVGPIDLNMILDKTGTPHGLEWTARTGFDALQAWSSLIVGDVGQQLSDFAAGRLDRFLMREELALTLRLSIPPYPNEPEEGKRVAYGVPLDPRIVTHPAILPDDVMQTPKGPVCSGRDGGLGVVVAVGRDIAILRQKVRALAESLDIPALQYRIDPVTRAEEGWRILDGHGFGREAAGGTVEAAQA